MINFKKLLKEKRAWYIKLSEKFIVLFWKNMLLLILKVFITYDTILTRKREGWKNKYTNLICFHLLFPQLKTQKMCLIIKKSSIPNSLANITKYGNFEKLLEGKTQLRYLWFWEGSGTEILHFLVCMTENQKWKNRNKKAIMGMVFLWRPLSA